VEGRTNEYAASAGKRTETHKPWWEGERNKRTNELYRAKVGKGNFQSNGCRSKGVLEVGYGDSKKEKVSRRLVRFKRKGDILEKMYSLGEERRIADRKRSKGEGEKLPRLSSPAQHYSSVPP